MGWQWPREWQVGGRPRYVIKNENEGVREVEIRSTLFAVKGEGDSCCQTANERKGEREERNGGSGGRGEKEGKKEGREGGGTHRNGDFELTKCRLLLLLSPTARNSQKQKQNP